MRDGAWMRLGMLLLALAMATATAGCDDEPAQVALPDAEGTTDVSGVDGAADVGSDGTAGDTSGQEVGIEDTAAETATDAVVGDTAVADEGGPEVTPDAVGDGDATPDVGTPSESYLKYAGCFPYLVEALDIFVEADAVVADSCAGTDHQAIDDIDKIVILGDSISAGTGASGNSKTYFELLRADLEAHYGHSIALESCAVGGSINANLMGQINNCFPGTEDARTLVVFTSGGNDIANMAVNKYDAQQGKAAVDAMVGYLDAAVAFFDDASRFPNGVFVVFADVYEYTDATANMESCPLAPFAGLTGTWEAGLEVFAYLTSEYGRVATKYGRDVMFMEESFCGHGYARDDAASPCNEVAGDLWFNFDCIHPNDAGHQAIADLFFSVITDGQAPAN